MSSVSTLITTPTHSSPLHAGFAVTGSIPSSVSGERVRSKVSGVHAVQSMRIVFCNGGKCKHIYK